MRAFRPPGVSCSSLRVEWLGQVVVGAGFEPRGEILAFWVRGCEQDEVDVAEAVLTPSYPAADLECRPCSGIIQSRIASLGASSAFGACVPGLACRRRVHTTS